MAFCTLEGNMALAEEFLKYVFSYVLKHCEEDMAFLVSGLRKELPKPFNRSLKNHLLK